MGKGQAYPHLGLAVPDYKVARRARRTSRPYQRRGGSLYRHSPWVVRLLRRPQLRDPNLEVVPKLVKLRRINLYIPSPVYKDWKQRTLPAPPSSTVSHYSVFKEQRRK